MLTPAQLLHDLYGSKALIKLAAGGVLKEGEYELLHRRRVGEVGDVVWSDADVGLLDEAFAVLGPKPVKGKIADEDEIRTYGHIVIDEAQDLTPMQLRMAARRSLNGSMTVVGDVAQATGPFAPGDWSEVLRHLPDRREARVVELTVGYRIPSRVMRLAEQVLRASLPNLKVPTSVRDGEHEPSIVLVEPTKLGAAVAQAVRDEQERIGEGSVAVVAPGSMIEELSAALDAAGVVHQRAASRGLDDDVSLVPVSLVKGLELDAVVVVEPGRILREEPQPTRSLYVALTRSTKTLSIVHSEPLPAMLA